jgi:hypothetical protein
MTCLPAPAGRPLRGPAPATYRSAHPAPMFPLMEARE